MLNLEGRIGGDAGLSSRGEEYALKLPQLVLESVGVSHFFHNLVPSIAYAKPALGGCHPEPEPLCRSLACAPKFRPLSPSFPLGPSANSPGRVTGL